MKLDLAILALVTSFGLFGLFSGAIRQLAQLAGLALAYLAAPRAARALMPLAQKRVAWPSEILGLAVSAAAFLLLAILGGILAHAVLTRLSRGRFNRKADGAVGLALGAGKGAALVFAVLSILLFVGSPQSLPPGQIADFVAGSKAVAFVRKHNLFSLVHVPELNKVSKLLAAAKNPEVAKALANNPDFNALLNDPKFRALLGRLPAGQAPNLGGAESLMRSPQMRALLQDPEFVKRLLKIQAAIAGGGSAAAK
ncbi:MAG TPA: CvpA family protein [Elusimicrobiota bacterium]|nr:CvpA family protein [Elusimicrobiota bacterium]